MMLSMSVLSSHAHELAVARLSVALMIVLSPIDCCISEAWYHLGIKPNMQQMHSEEKTTRAFPEQV